MNKWLIIFHIASCHKCNFKITRNEFCYLNDKYVKFTAEIVILSKIRILVRARIKLKLLKLFNNKHKFNIQIFGQFLGDVCIETFLTTNVNKNFCLIPFSMTEQS